MTPAVPAQKQGYKIVLYSGKTVLLREFTIKMQELAVQACSKRANGDQLLLSSLMQTEFLKLSLVSINDKEIKGAELENLDALFNYKEFRQVSMVIQKIAGVDEAEEGDVLGKLEVVNFGGT